MADFIQALKWMQEGLGVRLPTWIIPRYIKMSCNFELDMVKYNHIIDSDNNVVDWLCFSQYLSEEWEVFTSN